METLKAALEIGATNFHFTTSIKEVDDRGDFIKISELVCELAAVSFLYTLQILMNYVNCYTILMCKVDSRDGKFDLFFCTVPIIDILLENV